MGISNKIRNLSCKKFYHTRSSPLVSVIYRNILRLHIRSNLLLFHSNIPFNYYSIQICVYKAEVYRRDRLRVYRGILSPKFYLDTTWHPISRAFMRVYTFYMNKDIAAFVYFPEIHIDRKWTLLSTQSTGPLRTTARNLNPSSRESHRYIEHKEWRTALFSARISRLLSDSVGDDLLLTPMPTLFLVKRMARSSASADLRNAKLCGLYSHGRVITFPWPPYSLCPPPFFSPFQPPLVP